MYHAAFNVPLDVMVLFAEAGGPKVAVTLAQTCQAMKRRIDQRYEIPRQMNIREILNAHHRRRFGLVGKPTRMAALDASDIPHLPESTTHLFHCYERLPGPGEWVQYPPGIKTLTIHGDVYRIILPTGLEELRLYSDDHRVVDIHFPESLKVLVLGIYLFRGVIPYVPPLLEELTLSANFNQPLPPLPSCLRKLSLGPYWNQHSFPPFPDSLEELTINFFPSETSPFPAHLRILRLANSSNLPVNDVILPDGLEELYLSDSFSDLPKFPRKLKKLELPLSWNEAVAGVLELPPSLEQLHFGFHFRQPISELKLPETLRSLKVSEPCHQDVTHLTTAEGFSFTNSEHFDDDFNRFFEWHFYR